MKKKHFNGLHYIAGGNPPHLPCLWRGETRIAWWPAGVEPTLRKVSLVEIAYDARGGTETLGRPEVRAILGLDDEDAVKLTIPERKRAVQAEAQVIGEEVRSGSITSDAAREKLRDIHERYDWPFAGR